MPRLVTGLATAERMAAALEALAAALEGSGEVLLVGPTQRAADDLVRQADFDAGGLLGVHRMTLSHLARDLAALPMAEAAVAGVSRLGAEALAARATARARAEAPLEVFEAVADYPGFSLALSRTLEELRLFRTPIFEAAAPSAGDLARLAEHFERALEDQGLADYASILEIATEVARAGRHRLLDLPVVLLDAPPRSPGEEALLEALCARAPSTFAAVHPRDARGRAALERLLGAPAPQEAAVRGALDRARRYIFADEVPPAEAADDSLTFFSAPGEARESVEITRRILALVEEGSSFDQIAVFLRDPITYQPLLEDAFARAKVHGFFTRGARRPDPAGRALLALLACAADGLSATGFAEYLSLGQVPWLDEDGAPPAVPVPWVVPKDDRQLVFASAPPPSDRAPLPAREGQIPGHLEVPLAWEKLLVDAAVIGGQARWARRLEGLRRQLLRQLERLGHEGGARWTRKARDLAALENLQRFALPVIRLLADLPRAATWGVWLGQLEILAARTLAAPEPVLRVLAELRPMAEVGPVGIDEVQVVLTERLSFLREEPDGSRFGKVFVGSLDEAAGRSFSIVFVPGLAEGVLPKKVFEDPLLLDEARADLDPSLPTRDDALAEERLRLHLGLAAAEDRIFLSYPRVDVVQGRPRVPSFYALDILRAAEGHVPDLAALKRRAAAATDARLGWPAPTDPGRAIDETEFDLATLAGALAPGAGPIDGRGHYLVTQAGADPRAAWGVRNLRAQAARWRKAWSRADGLVTSPDRPAEREAAAPARAALERHLPSRRAYSPTALQSYAACPYRFFLQAILHLRPREAPEALEDLDPLTRGSLFHGVQFVLHQRLGEAGQLPVTEANLEYALTTLETIARQEAAKAEEALAPAIEAVWRKQMHALLGDLRSWLREVARQGGVWVPLRAELAFGLPPDLEHRDSNSTAKTVRIVNDRFAVRGSVDLVEHDEGRGVLRVTDHKTGRAPKDHPVYVGGGEHLQPLIYGLAVQKIEDAPVELGRLYYCTRRGGYSEVKIPIDEPGERHLGAVFETIEDAVQAGFLPAAPRNKACDWCDFRLACGPQEGRRVRRKDAERLAPLVQLREAP